MHRRTSIAVAAALAAACGAPQHEDHVSTRTPQAAIGENALGQNAMGLNAMGLNAMGLNAMGLNAMGLNAMGLNAMGLNAMGLNAMGLNGITAAGGTAFFIDPAKNTPMRDWMAAAPNDADGFLRYFVKCAFPPGYSLRYTSPTGAAFGPYLGAFGFAAGMVNAGPPRTITADEQLWVSSCMLAHLNLFHVHQYISVRANIGSKVGNKAAIDALGPSAAELFTTRAASLFFGNLFNPDGRQYRYSALFDPFHLYPATAQSSADPVPINWLEVVLGRECDYTTCFFTDSSGARKTAVENLGRVNGQGVAGNPATSTTLGIDADGLPTDPEYGFNWVRVPHHLTPDGVEVPSEWYRPVAVGVPIFTEFERGLVAAPWLGGWYHYLGPWSPGVTETGSVPIREAQFQWCGYANTTTDAQDCIGDMRWPGKLVGLLPGQALQITRTTAADGSVSAAAPTRKLGPQPFTAIVRYANTRTKLVTVVIGGVPRVLPVAVKALAAVAATNGRGGFSVLGTEWPGGMSNDGYAWLQVYPVYPNFTGAQGTIGLTVAGQAEATGCSGARTRTDASGVAFYACTAADAPELDTVGFVPGPPSCMAAGATSFFGRCPTY